MAYKRSLGLILLGIRFCIPVTAGEITNPATNPTTKPRLDPVWKLSMVTLSAANTLDTASSWGKTELNPVIGKGTFQGRQMAIGAGITVGVLLMEWMIVRRHPEAARKFKWVNFIGAGGVGAVAVHNYRLK